MLPDRAQSAGFFAAKPIFGVIDIKFPPNG
jgi:hypothetical protein